MQLALRDRRATTFGRRAWCGARCLLPAALALVAGCRSANPVTPPPPAGGTAWTWDEAMFAATVAPVLGARGCDTIECHGGGIRGTFALSPAGEKELAFDFVQAGWQADGEDPAASPLLRKPLAVTAGGTPHAADGTGGIFASTADPDYQAILAWIAAGVRE
ncbi:MAG: hypothetical protein IPK64_17390 [bacterium]|nr:hypothetical protein [bacterium]